MKKKFSEISTIQILIDIWKVFKPIRKRQFCFLLCLIIISGFFETFSLASIIPLISFLISPEKLWNNPLINSASIFLGINSSKELIFPITFLFIFTVIIASFFRIFTLWTISRFSAITGSDFSTESYRRNLYQPYSVHLSKNSAEVVSINSVEINSVVNTITNFLKMILAFVFSIFIIFSLFIYDLKLGLLSIIVFSIFYLLVTALTRIILYRNSKFIAKARSQQIKFLNEALGSIKDIILGNNFRFYLSMFSNIDLPMRLKVSQNTFISNFPRVLIESIAFIYIALLALYVVLTESNSVLILSKFAVIGVACQKLLPQLHQIFASWTKIKGSTKSIKKVLNSLTQSFEEIDNHQKEKFELNQFIFLRNIFFKYENSKKYIIRGLNLKINKNEKLGIIGPTGAGKSTLIDLIVGLVMPSKGEILIDNKKVRKNDRTFIWRSMISYIPQSIYLSDSTIIENIACGIDLKKINKKLVVEACKKAFIHDYILELPLGYNSSIGEMGIKLSGGQRQRIGIARAIYNILNNDKKVLVLDEATSSLDITVEKQIINSLNNISNNLTLIMVSHRYSTLLNCDRILKIDKGKIVDDGSPTQVLNLK